MVGWAGPYSIGVSAPLAQSSRKVPWSVVRAHMGVSTARTAVLLRQLEERGMLQRQADTTDSRQTLVTITPAGLQAAQEKWEQVVHAVAALLEQLGPEDAQALLRIQGRLLQIAACGSLRSCPHG